MSGTTPPDQGKLSWPWPFSRADLTAGLRRHLGDLSVRVTDLQPVTMTHRLPAIGHIRGMLVEYQGESGPGTFRLVVKEPRGTTRTGLAGAGRREVGVYQSLAPQLPVATPVLVAASPAGDWLLLEALRPAREASAWRKKDYLRAIDALAGIHDRFWGLAEDLNAYPWLSRPLTADFEVHVTAAVQAIERVVFQGQPEALSGSPARMDALARLTAQAEQVVEPLRRQPSTLLHGDYWPGNIVVLDDGSQKVFDWQLTAIGPGVLDVLVFATKSAWWFDSPPLQEEEIVVRYREVLARGIGHTWTAKEWSELWDHALMWRFLQEWIDLLAASPSSLLEVNVERLEQVWLGPVMRAIKRRLG
ncbi:MAG TPA: aminoglycoside phosphotransferase family protein [Anaerolineales bacterium]|nr:aminoglycoside phosphotransferase family protein [Anaerolineales bacterium]